MSRSCRNLRRAPADGATAGPSGGSLAATGRYRSRRCATARRWRDRARRRDRVNVLRPVPRGIFHVPPAPRPPVSPVARPFGYDRNHTAVLPRASTGQSGAQASLALLRALALPSSALTERGEIIFST